MGLFDRIERYFVNREYRKELKEAADTWIFYCQKDCLKFRDNISSKKILISNASSPGPREIAMILEYGLAQLGATIVTSKTDFHTLELRIWQNSRTDAVLEIYDSNDVEISTEIIHYQYAVKKAVSMLAI